MCLWKRTGRQSVEKLSGRPRPSWKKQRQNLLHLQFGPMSGTAQPRRMTSRCPAWPSHSRQKIFCMLRKNLIMTGG
ncbi:calcium channel, voltage-dependent, beta 2 subunit, isoform CRA_i [Rattus norvegicus]|nr:calcium channel, voltage-dependent, beta 2 subunit, isoform CRA_i [Rattus norvegicus]